MIALARKLLHSTGYGIYKIPDAKPIQKIDLYIEQYPEDSLKNKRFYNIGAGSFDHPLWTNVDYDTEWYASNSAITRKGIHFDLFSLDSLPVENETAEIVYTSHTVEHINNAAAQNMFNEAYRILKPNGFFRVTTPNIDLEYRAYKENDRKFFDWIDYYSVTENWQRAKYNKPLNEASIDQIFLHHFASSISTLHADGASQRIDDDELQSLFSKMEYVEFLDYCISKCPLDVQKKYPGNHMNWWNFQKMATMLKLAGFSKIFLSAYGQSFCPVLRDVKLFDNTHPNISLYVEAIK